VKVKLRKRRRIVWHRTVWAPNRLSPNCLSPNYLSPNCLSPNCLSPNCLVTGLCMDQCSGVTKVFSPQGQEFMTAPHFLIDFNRSCHSTDYHWKLILRPSGAAPGAVVPFCSPSLRHWINLITVWFSCAIDRCLNVRYIDTGAHCG